MSAGIFQVIIFLTQSLFAIYLVRDLSLDVLLLISKLRPGAAHVQAFSEILYLEVFCALPVGNLFQSPQNSVYLFQFMLDK